MEGGLNHMIKTPLLSSCEGANKHGLAGSSNSVAAMRCDFFSKLPDKVRSGFDPEAPFHLNLSKTTGLIEALLVFAIVRAYAKDHYFDVLTNIVGLVAAVLGDKLCRWIDPVGAIILAFYTISNWSGTVLENAVSLVGQSAPPQVLQKLTYLILRHHSLIRRVDTVRAYTFGVLYFVEVDIELPEDLPLKDAHAIGESLQIERLREPIL
ncbi:hypothetical protein ACE6H2_023859 [Prunus campanulata]